jgi:homoserine dehydrogenase
VTVSLLLIGFGHVARRFVTLLDELRPELDRRDVRVRVVGIATGRHGSVFDANGLDAVALAARREAGEPMGDAGIPPTDAHTDPDADAHAAAGRLIPRLAATASGLRVVIETTPLDVHGASLAIAHVRGALDAGLHVVTANKGPVAVAYRDLADRAAARGLSFLFEGAVMDGIPVFNLVRETLPACEIRAFRGVVNSTTNYILTAMEEGEPFEAALARMQAAGVAEADPSLDVDGWDAAAKAAALANVWFDARLTPSDVVREGIDRATGPRAIAARREGRRLKLVASGRRVEGGRADVRVALASLPADDPLAHLDGQANAIEIDTWPAGRIVITQRDGGLEKTAYALVADLLAIVARHDGRAPAAAKEPRP